MKGIMPIVIGVTAAMLAPLGEGRSRTPVPGEAVAASADPLATDGCAIMLRSDDGATADRSPGCEQWLRSAGTWREGRL